MMNLNEWEQEYSIVQRVNPATRPDYVNGHSAQSATGSAPASPAAAAPARTPANPMLRIVRGIIGLYAGAMMLYLLLRRIPGERLTLVALANSFAHVLVLPAFVLLPLPLALRWFKLAASLFPVMIAGVAWYAPYLRPRNGKPAPAAAPRYSLLTFNQRVLGENAAALADVIRRANADFVAMQELHPDTADLLRRELSDLYPYQALHPNPDFVWDGQGFLSRYPILEDDYRRPEDGYQRLLLDADGQRIAFYNCHARYPFRRGGFARRRADVRAIRARAESEDAPVLLAGDFNMTAQTEDYAHMREAFTDVYRVAGSGLGFTYTPEGTTTGWINVVFRVLSLVGLGDRPMARIDFVWHGAGWAAQSARVLADAGGSDHQPVYVEVALLDHA